MKNTSDRYAMTFRDMPRDLMTRALEKCRQQIPPIALKWKIVELVTHWLDEDRPKPLPPKIRP